jgi:NAD(P)H dehydrogenase (quinone)
LLTESRQSTLAMWRRLSRQSLQVRLVIGRLYELTGPRFQDMYAVAAEYSAALGRTITYVDVPLEEWRDQKLRSHNLPDDVSEHVLAMARLHAANRYDRRFP